MNQTRDRIISASRRTDIPGWYTPWFLEQISQGYFRVKNPYTRVPRKISALPGEIHSIVFWSKNFGPFLELQADQILVDKGYNLFFNFTLNSRSPLLEPGLPDLSERLDQAGLLCRRFGPEKLFWRFDPICFFQTEPGEIQNNLDDFCYIADAMAALGITRCVTSFYDEYKKIKARIRRLSVNHPQRLNFVLPNSTDQEKWLGQMAAYLEPKNIQLHLCCEQAVFKRLGPDRNIRENACIDGRLLKAIYGGNPEIRRDQGQRAKQGCKCTRSIDIGSYEEHPCRHNCLFCYARTGADIQMCRENSP